MSCLNCNGKINRGGSKYCSNKCQHEKQMFDAIDKGTYSFRTAKKYLTHVDPSCKICGIKDWNGKGLVLVMDHIDGDSTNNSLENLRLVCPNCDSQLPTFKNRNKGKGRYSRRERYQEGKSY